MRQKPGQGDMEVSGPKIVSLVCKPHKTRDNCEEKYCQWLEGKCVDPAAYQCSVQKKMIDCMSTKYISPAFAAPYLGIDEKCGKDLLGQAKKPRQSCDRGVRTGEFCETDEDCPAHQMKTTAGITLSSKPKCWKGMKYDGCEAGLQQSCKEIGFVNFAIMPL